MTRQLRSATIQAEIPSVLYRLSADAHDRLKQENSVLARALLTYIVRVMAERLNFASKVIRGPAPLSVSEGKGSLELLRRIAAMGAFDVKPESETD